MKTGVGVALLVFAMLAMLAANLSHFRAQADLLDKRPDLSSRVPDWWTLKRHLEFERLYKNEFPEGRKIRQYWWWLAVAFSTLAMSALLLK
jgi:hypothetical protein